MKQYTLLILGCIIWSGLHNVSNAQDKVWVQEDFDNNVRKWPIVTYSNLNATIKDGQYRMVSAHRLLSVKPVRTIFIDTAKDFTIEVDFQKIGRFTGNSSFSLLWGVKDYKNLNRVIITNISADVEKLVDSTIQHSVGIRKTSPTELLTTNNLLKIIRRGDSSFYFLNERRIGAALSLPFAGMDIGFDVSGELSISINSLTIFQDNAINVAPELPLDAKKESLGPKVNTRYDDIMPVITQDGKTLYFSSRYNHENTGTVRDAEEIWYSVQDPSGVWSKRRNMGWPLNNIHPNWVISVTPDNNTMLVANVYDAEGNYVSNGISLTQRNLTSWTIPQKVEIENFIHRNTWYNFTLATNQKIILMSIMSDDSYGDNDIYVSFLKDDDVWSQPKNLGPIINTISLEATPFLAADGKTLYYSSGGRPGYGGMDIFMSKRLDDSWTHWTEPMNLGPGINSEGDDESFTIPASGKYAYMTSTENAFGGSDIFRFALPLPLLPNPVILVSGNVYDNKTGQPMAVDISYRTLATNKEVGKASSDPVSGAYKIILPAGEVYSFYGSKEGYYAISENFDVSDLKEYKEIEKHLYLAPIEVGAIIRLNNIFFDFTKSVLREESFPELDRAVEFLNSNPNVRIEVAGHTDNVGNDASNMLLSHDRAKAVRDYFVSKGIQEARVIWKGYGESKPIKANDTEENRQFNRRVVFTILQN